MKVNRYKRDADGQLKPTDRRRTICHIALEDDSGRTAISTIPFSPLEVDELERMLAQMEINRAVTRLRSHLWAVPLTIDPSDPKRQRRLYEAARHELDGESVPAPPPIVLARALGLPADILTAEERDG